MSELNNTTVEATPVERTITIYATRGNSEPVDILSSAVTWGDFIPEVEKAGYSVSKVLCTESHTRMDLVNKLAVLPTVGFTIFIRNKETKSGADASEMSYKELRNGIANFFTEDKENAKNHFGNYTTKTTADLRSLYSSYKPKQAGSEEVVEKVETVADVVESVAQSKVVVVTNTDRITKIELLLSQIKGATSNEEISDRVEMVMEEVAGLRNAISEDNTEIILDSESVVTSPAEEGRLQAVEEAKQAEKARLAEEKRIADEEAQVKKDRKDALAKQAKELGL